MFQRMIDDFKESTGTAVRLTSLAGAAALALFITMSFLCAAAFVYVLQNYGLVQACLTGAAVFFVVTLIAAGCYTVRKNRVKARAAEAARSAAHSPLADPMLIAAGVQLIRAVGLKKLIPLLAVGGLALGLLASRNAPTAAGDDAPEA
jgi:hypothetical protein